MRLPVSWLNSLFTAPIAPERIAETLTRVGLEIESLEHVAPGLETVVVGQIVQIDPHPDADRLRVCQTDVGTGERLQIVTGAANVQLNDKIPVALVGSVLPGDKEIKPAKLRGVASSGMYCSLVELGLPPGEDGVHVLPAETPVGQPIAAAMGLGELILDVAVTANRPDALSVLGIARELAAALPEASLVLPEPGSRLVDGAARPVSFTVEDADRAPAYFGCNLRGVAVGPSPEWLAARLTACGMRPINNVVDASNYVMLLTGQPTHAFDRAKIRGDELRIRRAAEGEALVTLDGQARKLTSEDLVIADAERPLVVAGIMGGKDAEVDESTTELFLECAVFDPSATRKTARRLGLSTESSYRFERGVDPQGPARALAMLAGLIRELAGGEAVGDQGSFVKPGFGAARKLSFRLDQIDRLLGVNVPNPEVERILTRLGFGLSRHTDGVFDLNSYDVTVPGWRAHDVGLEADLVEEVARHFGYDNIPAVLPPVTSPVVQPRPERLERRVRELAVGLGFSEVVTPSLTTPEAERLAGLEAARHVALENPLGEHAVLRTALLPSLLAVLRHNRNQGASQLSIFEVGRTYAPAPATGGADERVLFAGALWGATHTGPWLPEKAPAPLGADFFAAKGALEALTEALGLDGAWTYHAADAEPALHPGRQAELRLDGVAVGGVGEIHPRVKEAYDLGPAPGALFWLDLTTLLASPEPAKRFRAFSRQPAVLRDLAVVVPEATPASAALAIVHELGGELLEDARVFDRYAGGQVPEGHVSLGISLSYRAPDRTLTVADVEPQQERILEGLKSRLGAALRA